MKHFRIILFAGLLAAGLAEPNQAAPLQLIRPSSVTISGDFQKPGSYNFKGQWRLLDAIVAAGGIKCRPEAVRLSVQRDGKTLPVNAVTLFLLNPQDDSQNLALQSGDVVVAQRQEAVATEKPVPQRQPKPLPNQLPDSMTIEFNGKAVRIVPLVKNRPLAKKLAAPTK